MAAFFSWLDSAGWEGDVVVLGIFVGIAWVLAQVERRVGDDHE